MAAIEPLGSVMTMQVQSIPAPKPETSADRSPEKQETSINSTVQTAEKVDNTTSVVENTQSKGKNLAEQNQEQQSQPSNEQVKKAVEKLNKRMMNSEAVFGIHEDTNRITIKIIDKDTKEVLKELPPEKTLDMIAKAWELAGILIDEKR